MKKLLPLILLLIFVSGCYRSFTTDEQDYLDSKTITKKHRLKPFNSIVVEGNTNVRLANGPYTAKITGHKKDIDDYQFYVEDHVLTIASSVFIGKTTIKITAPSLKNITVRDNTILKAKNFKTKKLTIVAEDDATINLEGRYNIDRIYQDSSGKINITWVDSDKLFVISNASGPIYLAGSTNKLDAKLTDHTLLNARYLHTKIATLFATDKARADIFVVDKLTASAYDRGNIYYYNKKPRSLTVKTKDSGNVLYYKIY